MHQGKRQYSSLIYLFILITLLLAGCNQAAGKGIEKNNVAMTDIKIEESTSVRMLSASEQEEATETENGSLLASSYFMSRLENGFLLHSKLHLGQIIEDAQMALGELSDGLSNYVGKGANYISDGSYAYLISQDQDKVLSISTSPQVLDYLHYDEIKLQLGEPDSEGYDPQYRTYIVSYGIGSHYIHFGFDKPHTEAREIFINFVSKE